LASHSPPSPPGPSFEDGVLLAALWNAQAELALQRASAQQVSVQAQPASQQVSLPQVSVQAQLASQQVSLPQVSVQAELVSQQVSLPQVSVQAELVSQQVSLPQVSVQAQPASQQVSLQQAELQALLQRPDEQRTALPQGRLWRLPRCVAVPRRWLPDAPLRHGREHHDSPKHNLTCPVSQLAHVGFGPQSQECEAGWRRLPVALSASRQLHSGRR
jgi:hypothetical protein